MCWATKNLAGLNLSAKSDCPHHRLWGMEKGIYTLEIHSQTGSSVLLCLSCMNFLTSNGEATHHMTIAEPVRQRKMLCGDSTEHILVHDGSGATGRNTSKTLQPIISQQWTSLTRTTPMVGLLPTSTQCALLQKVSGNEGCNHCQQMPMRLSFMAY